MAMETTRPPQPHEGVRGVGLGEASPFDLNSETALEQRLKLRDQVTQRWTDILHNRIPDREAAFDRMYNPRVGDTVMEHTTSFRADVQTKVQSIGILLVHEREEWACTDKEWAEIVAREAAEGVTLTEEDRLVDRASYIQYGPSPNDICRWRNCQFLAVPEDIIERVMGVQG